MNVAHLKSLAAKLVVLIDKSRAQANFQDFSQRLQQILVQNQRQTQITDVKSALDKSLASFDDLDLTYDERRLFDVLGYGEFVGSNAVEKLDKILRDSNFDPSGVNTAVEKAKTSFTTFANDLKSLSQSLARIPKIEGIGLKDGEQLLEITFLDGAAVENIVDFQQWIDNWGLILRNFSMLFGQPPESARIVYVQKSSPMIVDVATTQNVVIAIGTATTFVLPQIKMYLSIRKSVEEIKKLQLENKKFAAELEMEAEKFRKHSAEEITATIISGHQQAIGGDVTNGIKFGIENLFVFIDKGGRVDCTTANASANPEVHKLFAEIRAAEHGVDQLRLPAPEAPK
jgi:hypothetical protein